ncbi:MAG TPA: bacillithiol system redox-active protein YtxJ [Phaeodactylibacter sp.]|nr:bacillithiol system redox-active protein YtxJ [Phaeodactylibacter sp.]
MNWIPLESMEQVQQIIDRSKERPCVIFKHSTRCSISSMAKFRLEGDWDFSSEEIEAYYLDLIAHRDISAFLAEKFSVYHESPQILLIKNGECTYDASHLDITVDELKECLVTA